MEHDENAIPISIGTFWVCKTPPRQHLFKITTFDHEGVHFDTWLHGNPCNRYECYNSLLFFMENYIPFIKDEV